jgi:hypothetical protein
MKQNTYRIKRTSSGKYEIHRKGPLFTWIHDGGDKRVKSYKKSIYFHFWYDTYEEAKRGVLGRQKYDQDLFEHGRISVKYFYQPFPETEE